MGFVTLELHQWCPSGHPESDCDPLQFKRDTAVLNKDGRVGDQLRSYSSRISLSSQAGICLSPPFSPTPKAPLSHPALSKWIRTPLPGIHSLHCKITVMCHFELHRTIVCYLTIRACKWEGNWQLVNAFFVCLWIERKHSIGQESLFCVLQKTFHLPGYYCTGCKVSLSEHQYSLSYFAVC